MTELTGKFEGLRKYFENITTLCFMEWIVLTSLLRTMIPSLMNLKKKTTNNLSYICGNIWQPAVAAVHLLLIFTTTASRITLCTVLWSLFPHCFHIVNLTGIVTVFKTFMVGFCVAIETLHHCSNSEVFEFQENQNAWPRVFF